MKITDVEAIHLRLPQVDEIADGTQDVLIIRIHTDAGLVGIGEVSSQSYVCKAIFEAPRSVTWMDIDSSFPHFRPCGGSGPAGSSLPA